MDKGGEVANDRRNRDRDEGISNTATEPGELVGYVKYICNPAISTPAYQIS
jgi:hypothetical protein